MIFSKIKNKQYDDKFKREAYWLYLCIRELYPPDIKYSGGLIILMMLILDLTLMNNI